MSLLSAFESRMNSVFGSSSDGRTAPIPFKKLAKQAAREMESETFVIDGVNTAPGLYTILVSPKDDAFMRSLYPQIAFEISQFIQSEATRRGYVFVGDPVIRFMADPSTKSGKFAVFAENIDEANLSRLRMEEASILGIPLPAASPQRGRRSTSPREQKPKKRFSLFGKKDAQEAPIEVPDTAPREEERQQLEAARNGWDAPADQYGMYDSAQSLPDYADNGEGLDIIPESYAGDIEQSAIYHQREHAQGYTADEGDAYDVAAQRRAAQEAEMRAHEEAAMREIMAAAGEPYRDAPSYAASNDEELLDSAPEPARASMPSTAAPAAVPAPMPVPMPAPMPASTQPPITAQDVQVPVEPRTQRRSVPLVNPRRGTAQQQQGAPVSLPTCLLVDISNGQAYRASAPRTILGRERTPGGIVLRDPNISRHHAEITFDGRNWRISDLRSTNGTLVNDVDVTDCILREGDIITLGLMRLEFKEN